MIQQKYHSPLQSYNNLLNKDHNYRSLTKTQTSLQKYRNTPKNININNQDFFNINNKDSIKSHFRILNSANSFQGFKFNLSKQNIIKSSRNIRNQSITINTHDTQPIYYTTIQTQKSYQTLNKSTRQKKLKSTSHKLFKATQNKCTLNYNNKFNKNNQYFSVPIKNNIRSQFNSHYNSFYSKNKNSSSSNILALNNQYRSNSQNYLRENHYHPHSKFNNSNSINNQQSRIKKDNKQKIVERVKNLLTYLDKKQLKMGINSKVNNSQNKYQKLKLSSLQYNIQIQLNKNTQNNQYRDQYSEKSMLNHLQQNIKNNSFNNNYHKKYLKSQNSPRKNIENGLIDNICKHYSNEKNQKQRKINNFLNQSLNINDNLNNKANNLNQKNTKYQTSKLNSNFNSSSIIEYKKEKIALGSVNDLSQLVNKVNAPQQYFQNQREQNYNIKNQQKINENRSQQQKQENNLKNKQFYEKQTNQTKKQETKIDNLTNENKLKQQVKQGKKQPVKSKKQQEKQIYKNINTEDNVSTKQKDQYLIDNNSHQNKYQVKHKKQPIKQKKSYHTLKAQKKGFSFDNVDSINQIQEIKLIQDQNISLLKKKPQAYEPYKINIIQSKQIKKQVKKQKFNQNIFKKYNFQQEQSLMKPLTQQAKQKPEDMKQIKSASSSKQENSNEKKQSKKQQINKKDSQHKNLQTKMIQLNEKISMITPIGQVAGYCSKYMKKSNLNWYIPSTLLYKQCYRYFKSAQEIYKKGYNQKLININQYENFINQNLMIRRFLQKLIKAAQKKKKLPVQYSSLVQPQNKIQISNAIFKQIIIFTQNCINSQQVKNPDIARCTLRMLDAACILFKMKGNKYKLAKSIDQLKDNQVEQLIPILFSFIKKKMNNK